MPTLRWADDIRTLGVRANADTADDAAKARVLGAEGIGLCRTEHMFFGQERHDLMVEAILATDDTERGRVLQRLRSLQVQEFEHLFREMRGLPVTIRLLDPPLHEFLPERSEIEGRLDAAQREGSGKTEQLHRMIDRAGELEEANPMLGTRGVRLGLMQPDLYEMQVEAIISAMRSVEGTKAEVMVPLVAFEGELRMACEMIRSVAERFGFHSPEDYSVGTMIELPRACLQAGGIAEFAQFFSFGTNDLTQTALGFSRDDIESEILPRYLDLKILDRSPFETLDMPGVGELIEVATSRGRQANQDLKLGVCSEHGGDPASIEFFNSVGIDYVSCSPYPDSGRPPCGSPSRRKEAEGLSTASRISHFPTFEIGRFET